MRNLGNIVWVGIHADSEEEISGFHREMEARNVDPEAIVWLLDSADGWYPCDMQGLPYLGNISKSLIQEYSWIRKENKG